MPTVKKLRLILSDAIHLMAELERRNRNVLLRFTCYRNNQPVHKSGPVKRNQLASVLPETCRKHRATEIDLLITGTNQKLETAELYRESFILASKDALPMPYQSGGFAGLGGMEQYGSAHETWPGLAGSGAPPEAVVIAQQMANDMRFHDDYDRLKVEADGLRQKVKELEKEVAEQQATIDAKSGMANMMEQLKPFVPIAAGFLGVDSKAGQALAGLGNADTGQTEVQDDPITESAIGMLRQFMGTLHPTHKSQLIWIMQNVSADHNLITRLANFIQQSKAPGQSSAGTQRPEQSQRPKGEKRQEQRSSQNEVGAQQANNQDNTHKEDGGQ